VVSPPVGLPSGGGGRRVVTDKEVQSVLQPFVGKKIAGHDVEAATTSLTQSGDVSVLLTMSGDPSDFDVEKQGAAVVRTLAAALSRKVGTVDFDRFQNVQVVAPGSFFLRFDISNAEVKSNYAIDNSDESDESGFLDNTLLIAAIAFGVSLVAIAGAVFAYLQCNKRRAGAAPATLPDLQDVNIAGRENAYKEPEGTTPGACDLEFNQVSASETNVEEQTPASGRLSTHLDI